MHYVLILLSIIVRITSRNGVGIMSFAGGGFGLTINKIKCSDQDATRA